MRLFSPSETLYRPAESQQAIYDASSTIFLAPLRRRSTSYQGLTSKIVRFRQRRYLELTIFYPTTAIGRAGSAFWLERLLHCDC